MENSSPSQYRRGDSAALISLAIILIVLFGHLGAIGLVGPDEPRYGWIARAMANTGDWVTPRLFGEPWFEKPILYYWAGAAGFLLHLPAEWALRLPSAFAALATGVAIGWLARKHYGADAIRLTDPMLFAPLLFATTVAAIGFSRAATPDMLFSASITLAMASAATVFRRTADLRGDLIANEGPRPTAVIPLMLFGAFLGIGVLAKGPAAVLLAGGALALWAIFTKKWRPVFRLAHPYAILAFCVVALPWYILCALRNPQFLRVFILQHNFERYLTPVFQHPQPFWFFGPIALLAMLPWTVLLWPAAREAVILWREKSLQDSPGFFFSCWAIFPILFFSFSQSKLPGYILPSIPALALICAVVFKRSVQFDPTASRLLIAASRIGIGIGTTWAVLGVSILLWLRRLPESVRGDFSSVIFVSALIAISGAIVISVLAVRRKRSFVFVAILMAASLVEFSGLAILPRLDPYISARWHAQLLHNNLHPDRIFVYRLPRSLAYGLAFYLRRELPEWSPADPDPALVLTTPAGLKEMRRIHRFFGDLDESYRGILYVPIGPLPR